MLRITSFSVGQGMSTLLEFEGNTVGVIDCGSSRVGENSMVEYLKMRAKRDATLRIAFVVLTHLDWDHINSFGDLVGDQDLACRIEILYYNDVQFRVLRDICLRVLRGGDGFSLNARSSRSLNSLGKLIDFSEKASEYGCEVSELVSPEGSDLGTFPVRLRIEGIGDKYEILVWAPSTYLKQHAINCAKLLSKEVGIRRSVLASRLENADWNSASIVLSVGYGGQRVFICGDATAETWQAVLERCGDAISLKCEGVLAWHHGARLGALGGRNYDEIVWNELLGDKKNSAAVISHGCDNGYGHPHRETLYWIGQGKGNVFCTQLKALRKVDWEEVREEFRDIGLGLQLGSGGDVVFMNERDLDCCGDVVLTLCGGELVVEGSNFKAKGEVGLRVGCCQNRDSGMA